MIKIIKIETPLGEMVAGATEMGVCLLEFNDRRMLPTEYKDLKRLLDTSLRFELNSTKTSMSDHISIYSYLQNNIYHSNTLQIRPNVSLNNRTNLHQFHIHRSDLL